MNHGRARFHRHASRGPALSAPARGPRRQGAGQALRARLRAGSGRQAWRRRRGVEPQHGPRRAGPRAGARGGARARAADGSAADGGAGRLSGLALPAQGCRSIPLARAASCSTARWQARCASLRPRVPASEIPAWLVVGAELDIAAPREDRQEWSRTSLSEEAGPDITRTDILQSLSAHVLTWLNTWQEEGFRPVHDQWLFRAEGREEPNAVAHRGETYRRPSPGSRRERQSAAQDDRRATVRSLSYIDSADLIDPDAP